VIGTGKWAYAPIQLQLAGRQAMEASVFLNGAAGLIGSQLGE
jgi:hypothetical protein